MDKLESVVTAINNGTIQQLDESLQTSRANALNAKLLPRDLIENLWLLMARLYGHKWTSNFGDQVDPGNVWAACLRGISADQIRFGMSELVRLECEWPPSGPEFRGMCSGESDTSWEHRNQAKSVDQALDREPVIALENITQREQRKAKGRERMAAIRAELRI